MKALPKIALGAWGWNNQETFGNRSTIEDLKAVYEAARANGLNLWDTAAVYGMGASESMLGELAKDTPREELILSTKFTPDIGDGTPQAMQNMLDGSKERLRADVIDIYWIHSLAEIKRAAAILGDAGLKLSAVQNHYSLLNRSSEDSGILQYCRENGITFFAYMVLEQGALSGSYDTRHPFPAGSSRAKMYTPMLAEIETLTGVLRQVGEAHGIGAAQTAIVWAIAKGTLPIVGATKVHHVTDAAKAASVTLTAAEMALMEETAAGLGLSTVRHWEKKME